MEANVTFQKQHYNMAAIVARYWRYRDSDILDKRSRESSICLFNTESFFSLSKEDIKNFPNMNYFDLIKEENFRKNKIKSCISSSPLEDNNKNRKADSIFTSLLISPSTEKQIGVDNIETNFLDFLKNIDDDSVNKEEIFNSEVTANIIQDFISLQYARSPIHYRFILNNYLQYKAESSRGNYKERIDEGNPILFQDFLLLDSYRMKDFHDFANKQIIGNYFQLREEVFINYRFALKPVRNVYVGDLTTFFLDLDMFGVSDNQIIKMLGNDLSIRETISQIIYLPISTNLCLLGVPFQKIDNGEFDRCYQTLANFLFLGYQNLIQFLYSRYIAIPPSHKQEFITYLNDFLNLNDVKELYVVREKEHGYINGLEMMLEKLEKYKKLLD